MKKQLTGFLERISELSPKQQILISCYGGGSDESASSDDYHISNVKKGCTRPINNCGSGLNCVQGC